MIDLAIWSEGGLSYTELKNLPVDELLDVFNACRDIQLEQKKQMEKMRAKK